MKPIVVDTKSRFHRFIKWSSGKNDRYYERVDGDSCWYIRHIIWALFWFVVKMFAFMIVVASISIFMSEAGQPIVHYFMPEGYEPSPWKWAPVYILAGILSVTVPVAMLLGLAGLFAKITTSMRKRLRKNKENEEQEPTATGELYRSWKNKLCSKVVFK